MFFNCIKNEVAYIKTYRTHNACFILPCSSCIRQFAVQTVLEVHSDIHIGIHWCVNYCSTWTKTGTLLNFTKLPDKKFRKKINRGAWVFICRHIRTNKHTEAKRHIVTTFHDKYAKKKLLALSWKCCQALFLVVEQLKSMPNLANECSRENYTQLSNLCNIKVKQEFELIMLDIKVIYVNMRLIQKVSTVSL